MVPRPTGVTLRKSLDLRELLLGTRRMRALADLNHTGIRFSRPGRQRVSGLTKTVLSIGKAQQADITQLWCDYMGEVYYPLDCTPIDPRSFEGSITAVQLSSMGISRFNADALRTVRRRQLSGAEDVVFIFPTREREHFGHLGIEDEVGPGEVYVLNASEPYWTQIADKTQNITIKVAAACLRERFPLLETTFGRRDVANAGMVPVVAQLALQTSDMAPLVDQKVLKRTEDNILDLICIMLETRHVSDVPESTTAALSDITFQRLSSFLSMHFRDPTLAPEHAATSLRVSLRYVHKVCQIHGTTFGRELIGLRLREADRLLRAPFGKNASPLPISEVAYICGFSSQTHFSARFKEHFGYTPNERRLNP